MDAVDDPGARHHILSGDALNMGRIRVAPWHLTAYLSGPGFPGMVVHPLGVALYQVSGTLFHHMDGLAVWE